MQAAYPANLVLDLIALIIIIIIIIIIQRVRFIMSRSMPLLSHRRPVSARTACDSRYAQGHDKRDTVWGRVQVVKFT
jgi:hypothetical protein